VSITFQWVCSSIFVAEFRKDIRVTIPVIAERLKHSNWSVREAAIEFLSRLAAQGTY